MNPPLTVLIAAAGQPELLRRTLQSLAAGALPHSYAGTVVVENGPPTGIESIVADFERELHCRYLYASAANKSHALNVGLSTIPSGLIVFLDDDVRVAPGLLAAYAAGARDVVRGQCYGGPLAIDLEAADSPAPNWMKCYLPKSARGWQLAHSRPTPLKKEKFIGPNWAAFAEDLRQIGGFETRLGPGATTGATGQETDAQTRLRAAGVQSYYLPEAAVWHYVRSRCHTPQWMIERARRHGREWGLNRARRPNFTVAERWVYAAKELAAQAQIRWLQAFGKEQGQFRAEFLKSLWAGRREGLELGRRWHQLPLIGETTVAHEKAHALLTRGLCDNTTCVC